MTSPVDLHALAAIWVERWLKYGGSLIADLRSAKVTVWMNDGQWRSEAGPAWQRLWRDGWMVGRWRELNDLLNLIPGLREAVVDHVAEHGNDCGRADCKAMVRVTKNRPGEEPEVPR